MILKVLSSSSEGNGYILDSGTSILLIECGVSYKTGIMPACNFRRKDIVGCLVSHHHQDHASNINELREHGIPVYVPSDMEGIEHTSGYRCLGGGFSYMGLQMHHVNGDCTPCECWGFIIRHQDMGWILFVTDTAVIPQDISAFKFSHVMIAANYSTDILDRNIRSGKLPKNRAKHTKLGHMSIETCIEELKAMNLQSCLSITLLHLSEFNSDANRFRLQIENETGIVCKVAHKGLELNFDTQPF